MGRVTDSTRDVFVSALTIFPAEMLSKGIAETTIVPEPAVLDPSVQTSIMLSTGIPVAAENALAIFETGRGDPKAAINRSGTVTATENTLPEASTEVIFEAASRAAESWKEICTGGSNN